MQEISLFFVTFNQAMDPLMKVEDLTALKPYNELDLLNQLQLARIGRFGYVALPPPSLGVEPLLLLVIMVDSQLEQSMWY